MKRFLTWLLIAGTVLMLSGCSNTKQEMELTYRDQGIKHMNSGDYTAAVTSFTKALQQAPGRVRELELDISYYKAAAQYKSNDYSGAIDTYTNLIDYKASADLYILRGSAYIAAGETEKAYADFDQAMEMDGKNYESYIRIYESLVQTDAEKAKGYLNQALKLEGKKDKDYLKRGEIYYYLGDYQNAEKELKAALEKENTESLLYLGKTYEAVQDPDTALDYYQQYQEKGQESQEVYNIMGVCKRNKGDYEGALQSFQAGLTMTGDTSFRQTLLFNEAVVYEYLLDFDTAASKMAAYLEEFPEDTKAQKENEFLQTRRTKSAGEGDNPGESGDTDEGDSQNPEGQDGEGGEA
ncbi:tetratricopeptide repeat protein [Diplocloster modestus]|uniref:Tetratricopeptide repeat protein n=1 Tax=Diplocloster modestus TaxID=2850322 RepID=A0ABS6K304_9FIRM|nr:tetratricopeptide repeat protein [Diplocloster modestus]MBU9724894.1 tetratricopeptide repeat protein [Diplocloster modestus]